ncbi:transposase [Haliscomenobacter sp.]|uniref:transposase n=1 Tax=Haliscomenobacter sp. TaxID=2717303 RepID=UPI003BAB01A4
MYISKEAIKHWKAECPKHRGGKYVYSDRCIESIFMLKTVFKMSYRQATGFTQSLLSIIGLKGLKVPCYTQVNRRVKEKDH